MQIIVKPKDAIIAPSTPADLTAMPAEKEEGAKTGCRRMATDHP
jgi:hypothetical protein